MNLFPNKIKTQLLPETKKPFQATKNSTTLARKIAQSWSLIHLVLIQILSRNLIDFNGGGK